MDGIRRELYSFGPRGDPLRGRASKAANLWEVLKEAAASIHPG